MLRRRPDSHYNDTQHNDAQPNNTKCYTASSATAQTVAMLSVVILRVIMLNDVFSLLCWVSCSIFLCQVLLLCWCHYAECRYAECCSPSVVAPMRKCNRLERLSLLVTFTLFLYLSQGWSQPLWQRLMRGSAVSCIWH